jgi:glyoxylate/hydroxypyruvate reductase
MTARVLFAGRAVDWPRFQPPLQAGFEAIALPVDLIQQCDDPGTVDYMIHAPSGPISDFTPFSRLKLVQSLWAGVENIVHNKTLTMPLARMVDPGMVEGMVDYVIGNVMRHHLGTDRYAQAQPGDWQAGTYPKLARERTVGILGTGSLGMACARSLRGLGFKVLGWSRSQKSEPGIECHAGADGLLQVITRSDILVLLVPDTAATENLLSASAIAMMPKGASVINPGRGVLIDDDALLAALDSGHLSQATLDVFRIEPLPRQHRYWSHPNVLVTPHIASETRPDTSAKVAVENIRRGEAGEPFLHLVDRALGY